MQKSARNAAVVGAGPNGLAAAITLAQAGMPVTVYEAEAVAGGGARTLELTLPGFRHDFGSAVHPMAVGSPFFRTLPLAARGLEWIHSPVAMAHPLDDGTAVLLVRDIDEQCRLLGEDGPAWRRILEPLSRNWWALAEDILEPLSPLPRHPLLLARMGAFGALPAAALGRLAFRGVRARSLMAGLAAHSFLRPSHPFSASFGLVMAATAHAVGWPIPRGGSQAITDALIAHLQSLGGVVQTATAVERIEDIGAASVTLCDTTPRQLLKLAGDRLHSVDRHRLTSFRPGPGIFKVDYALSEPIPWEAKDCARAATVHVGGDDAEIAVSESAVAEGKTARRPFLIVVQPSLFDRSRAPLGRHTAWAYCHVPNGSTEDMLPRLEAQIERFAPGFRECVLARRVFPPADLQHMDRNLEGGDIGGGAMDGLQMFLRPGWRFYATSDPSLYLCSASTPPGGGVHGMCGYNAARMALRHLRR
ncbi:MAG TPA: NAD(P)/FAD-dependent oxidoreductase [Acidobacteriaceae bacterium]